MALVVLSFSVPANAQPSLVFEGEEIVGVSQLEYDGELWDVSFKNGTCAEVYSGCDDRSDFPFYDSYAPYQRNDVAAARVALENYLGTFVGAGIINPVYLIRGCDYEGPTRNRCIILTPYEFNVGSTGDVGTYTVFLDSTTGDLESSSASSANLVLPADTTTDARYTWAVWTPTPEPSPPVIFDTDFALPAMPIGDGSGTPVCVDDVSGLLVAGCDVTITADEIDPTSVQRRVDGVCTVGSVISAINADGSVVCTLDSDDQNLSLLVNELHIEDGNSVDLSGFLDNTDAQSLGQVLVWGDDAENHDILGVNRIETKELSVSESLKINSLVAAPASSDCDAEDEAGSMVFDATNDLLYICSGASGWVSK